MYHDVPSGMRRNSCAQISRWTLWQQSDCFVPDLGLQLAPQTTGGSWLPGSAWKPREVPRILWALGGGTGQVDPVDPSRAPVMRVSIVRPFNHAKLHDHF